MFPQTDFRPQIHGFDFNNHWDVDDNYRSFIREKVRNVLPIIARVVATNPAFGGMFAGGLPGSIAIADAFSFGTFSSIILPALINQIVTVVDDKIDDFVPDSYGACGGMALAALDYYYRQWVVPKGINLRPDPLDTSRRLLVPPKDPGVDQTLRNFIYDRLKDSWGEGGVMDKTIEWFVIMNTIPNEFGGGGPELQNRTKNEWVKLCGLLDQGKPQPINVMYDTWNIFDNHQVVAYGYGGDPFTGDAFINIYDNNSPNQELRIYFDFTKEQIEGFHAFSNRAPINTNTKVVKGFFCTTYIPKNPPVGWGLEAGLTVTPSPIQSARETFTITGNAVNRITFLTTDNQQSMICPIVEEAMSIPIATPLALLSPVPARSFAPYPFSVIKSFNHSGDYLLFAKAKVFVWDGTNITNDAMGKPLMRTLYLPVLNAAARNSVHLHVIPRLTIKPYNSSGTSCYFPNVEGRNITLMVDKNPFPGETVKYEWSANGVNTGNPNHEKFEIFALPPAGTVTQVKVKITSLNTGSVATGEYEITSLTSDGSDFLTNICQVANQLTYMLHPFFFDPLGPDKPDFRGYIEKNYRQIGASARRISQLITQFDKGKNKGNKP